MLPETESGPAAALAEAKSPSWRRRARAGWALAAFADAPEATQALVGLLLDPEDTAVTRQTAEALTRVGTVSALRLVALAETAADDNHADWLRTGVLDALMPPAGTPGRLGGGTAHGTADDVGGGPAAGTAHGTTGNTAGGRTDTAGDTTGDAAAAVVAVCRQLARDPEEAVRRGAAEISVWADDLREWSQA